MTNDHKTGFLYSGHTACAGCGALITLNHVLKILGKNTIMVVPACCTSITIGTFPCSTGKIPIVHCPFASAGAVATGIRAQLDLDGGTKTNVLVWAGDGGTFDIGLQALSGAVERNENILWCCYDNEAYMNTGIQRSSATPYGARTTTTPLGTGKLEVKKDIMLIMKAHNIPYAATATIGFLDDLQRKIKVAKNTKGTRFLHLLSPCASGWKMDASKTVEISRLAVQTNVFPLYETWNGEKVIINYTPEQFKAVQSYLSLQGRFSHLTEKDIEDIQTEVDCKWYKLNALEKTGI